MDQTPGAGRVPGEPPLERDVSEQGAGVGTLVDEHEYDDEGPLTGDLVDAGGDGGADDGVRLTIDDPSHSKVSLQTWVSWGIVAICSLIVLLSLDPGLLLQNTTATGGDMGAHVWGPRFLADHLLPNFRLSGWTQDWYAGFPAYVFYMVVPSLIVLWVSAGGFIWSGSTATAVLGVVVCAALLALLTVAFGRVMRRLGPGHWARPLVWTGYVLLAVALVPVPYNIAFKLVTVSGLVTLPIAAYFLARSARVAFPGPPLIALATLPFIYDKGFTILGGNGASTLAGEFAFSIALSLALVYLGVVFRGVRTGRDRALGAVLLALTILCHLIPAIFAGIATVLVLVFLRREDRTPWWDANALGRWIAAGLVALTLLSLVADHDLPVINTLRDLPGASVWFPSQWWFPALATAAAIALFTNFEPRYLPWTRELSWPTAARAAAVTLFAVAFVMWKPTWWTLVLAVLWLVMWCFAGVDTRLVAWIALVAPVGGMLTGFWSIPFLGNSTYMNDMGWEKYTNYADYLLAIPELDSGGMPYRNIVFALAGLGVLLSLIHRVRFGWFLSLTVVALAWIFRYFPQYRLWNARLLPFYYLALYLLAGLAIALIIRSIAIAVQDLTARREEPVAVGIVGACLATAVMAIVVAGSFRMLPGGQDVADPAKPGATVYRWAGLNFQRGIVNDWARWNYAGLEGKPAYPEYSGVMDMMRRVSDEHGCGRAFWEYESDLNRYGTTMALMLLPDYTDGCVGSMEGLYFEASSTTPFHFLTQSELSAAPSRAQRELPYSSFDIAKGVSHLQMLGVKYYMATSQQAIDAARTDDRLTEVAYESFVFADANGTPQTHNWGVFEVADSGLVVPLEHEPVVLEDADDHIDGWVYAKERLAPTPDQIARGVQGSKSAGPATEWFNDPEQWDVYLATSGPESWRRTTPAGAQDGAVTNPPVEISEVRSTEDSISFDVDQIGVPVLVRTSYFPNWSVSGAEGPYRVTPNFMVVVPTEEHVVLSYGYSRYDLLGWFLTVAGLVGVAGLGVLDHRRRLVEAAAGTVVTDDVAAGEPPVAPVEGVVDGAAGGVPSTVDDTPDASTTGAGAATVVVDAPPTDDAVDAGPKGAEPPAATPDRAAEPGDDPPPGNSAERP